ncbi:MAG: hypothetical protein NTY00_10070 [Deltaproteobacteria bacterium]|nr:hypothetical protein [Deltaproteobacteria bacterium]
MVDFYAEVIEPARQLEAELGLPGGFLERLEQEDDWSFVVKTHALIEAAVAHALVARTGLNEAQEFFARLELSNNKTGKLALSESLGLLNSEERKFIRSLSETRNFFVHDVKNVGVDLRTYFGGLSRDKRKHLAASFCYVDFSKTEIAVTDAEALKRLETEPKQAMWSTAIYVAALLQLQIDTTRAKRLVTEYKLQISEP